MLKIFVCFGIIITKDDFDILLVAPYRFPKKSIGVAGSSALGLFGLLDGNEEIIRLFTCFWDCRQRKWRGKISVKWGETMVTRG